MALLTYGWRLTSYIGPDFGYLGGIVTADRTNKAIPLARASLRRRISVAGVVLVALSLSAPSASGSLLRETADTVGANLPTVPTPPQRPVEIPAHPPAPVEAPAHPPVPADVPAVPPSAAIKSPTAAAPKPKSPTAAAPKTKSPTAASPKTRSSSPGVVPAPSGAPIRVPSTGDTPSVDRVTGEPKQSGGPGTSEGSPTAAAPQGSVSKPNGVDSSAGRNGGRTSGAGSVSIEAAEIAPLARWLAYVWPAVALGPGGDFALGPVAELLAALQAPLEAVTSLPLSVVPRLLSALGGQTSTGPGGVVGLSGHSVVANPRSENSPGIQAPGGKIFIFILIAALTALLLFTLGRELRLNHHHYRL